MGSSACAHDDVLTFPVPSDLHEMTPDGAAQVSICKECFELVGNNEDSEEPDFKRLHESFPTGETGAAMALAIGLIVDSLALHREEITALFDYVSDRGADPWLVLERLASDPDVGPRDTIDRSSRQLEQLLR